MVDAESAGEEAFDALLYGMDSLAAYWFHKNNSRRLVVHRKNRENPGVLYHGFAPHEKAIQDAFKAHMKQGADIRSDQTKN
ncbi:hypothetical protein FOMG_06290 [Fusarium oxysporum f. sp. melonis 26406]|uniref:Uncharacterized protein n=1 Tax=Fusarium oxysporum f. sp. melonis 26406 TaxID=1089452 RepID=X0B0K1_FUSOX|nr:hypothetical protein FOMG_06290 [Fusarium oxysporum f. sp. melonis 26406]KAJ9421568.1 hypothetical protein QL093DRAFT_2115452 [Fusarium oxysporum]